MKAWLAKHMPAPMAAPETAELRAARIRLIAAVVLVGVMTLFWGPVAGVLGAGAFALLVGLVVFIAVQGSCWVSAKNAADDDYLMSRIANDE
ncbi:hypothetical protein [Novosphingobium sp. HII-3]|uniref:hypothetical protein n=1 Tax=Novosphingobium sp. HII-3 TaxID=2075565 RepID=UPI000CDA08AC|nr:hypothetical protein [Novosphingobium sp. HII-3]